jgi:hypothetical protein
LASPHGKNEPDDDGESGRRCWPPEIEIGGEPIATIGRAYGDIAAGIDVLGGDAGAGLTTFGAERLGGAGVIEEGEGLLELVETLGHASWFENNGRIGGCWGKVGEIVEGVGERMAVGKLMNFRARKRRG